MRIIHLFFYKNFHKKNPAKNTRLLQEDLEYYDTMLLLHGYMYILTLHEYVMICNTPLMILGR